MARWGQVSGEEVALRFRSGPAAETGRGVSRPQGGEKAQPGAAGARLAGGERSEPGAAAPRRPREKRSAGGVRPAPESRRDESAGQGKPRPPTGRSSLASRRRGSSLGTRSLGSRGRAPLHSWPGARLEVLGAWRGRAPRDAGDWGKERRPWSWLCLTRQANLTRAIT